jgi:hypothetical protein
MIPYVLVGLGAISGFLTFGPAGLLTGGALGYLLSLTIGILFAYKEGGLIPKSAKDQVAKYVIENNPELVRIFTNSKEHTVWAKAVHEEVESLYQIAIELAPPVPSNAWQSRKVLAEAAEYAHNHSPHRMDDTFTKAVHTAILETQYPN